MYPCLLARMVYQVGRPAMFDGNRFLPDTGMPIWKMDRRSTRLAVWLPDRLTVAAWMLKWLTTAPAAWRAGWPASARASCGAMDEWSSGGRGAGTPPRLMSLRPADPRNSTAGSYILASPPSRLRRFGAA